MGNAKLKKEKYSIVFLMVGFIFLANPIWTLTDILPDLLGWIMIWFGLMYLSDVNENFFVARRNTLYLAAVCLLKTMMWFFLQGETYTSDNLLATTISVVLDVLCMLLFFKAFLGGTEEMTRAADCNDLYLKTDNVRFLSNLFVWGRAAFTIIPELTALADLYISHYGPEDMASAENPESAFLLLEQFAASKNLLLIVFSAFEIILAVVWLVSILPYVNAFRKRDVLLQRFASDHVEEDDTQRIFRKGKNLKGARLAMLFAIPFCLDLQLDGVRIIPLCLFPAILLLGCVFWNRFAGDGSFRKAEIWFGISSVLLILFELYRRFCTVWDMRAIEEATDWEVILTGILIVPCISSLIIAWLLFAREANRQCAEYHCGELNLHGLPFFLLAVFCVLQTAVCVLPMTSQFLTLPRILTVAAFWFVSVRRVSAFAERANAYLSVHDGLPSEKK